MFLVKICYRGSVACWWAACSASSPNVAASLALPVIFAAKAGRASRSIADLRGGAGGYADLCRARLARRVRGAPLAQQGSISGALLGAGDVRLRHDPRARPASRLLVLSANGNCGAVIRSGFCGNGASLLRGLSPAREWLTNLWLVDGGAVARHQRPCSAPGRLRRSHSGALAHCGSRLRLSQPAVARLDPVRARNRSGGCRGLAVHLPGRAGLRSRR